MEDPGLSNQPVNSRKITESKSLWIIVSSVVFCWLLLAVFVGSFSKFQTPRTVEIMQGDSLKQVAIRFKEAGVIHSSSLLSTFVILFKGESHIVSGIYSFEKREGVLTAAKRIISGKTNIRATKITFPEGFTAAQIARRIFEFFPNFDSAAFLELGKGKEGFLFPDTYFFLPSDTPEMVIARLEETFWAKTGEKFGWKQAEEDQSIYNILILASILEEEVQDFSDKKKVADLFLRRMKIGMALQADSTLVYVTGRDSLSLTVDDLKSDSPYNTYTNRGLPPTPISNPGLESIEAALNPEPNKYFYFLTDKEGKVYYAKTFEEHKLNKQKYLR